MEELQRQQLITDLELEGVSEDVQNEVIERLGALVMDQVLQVVSETLPDDEVIAFEKVVSTRNTKEIFDFLVAHVEHLDIIIDEARKYVVEEYKKLDE